MAYEPVVYAGPGLIVASSLLPGLVIFFLREGSQFTRTLLNLGGAVAKLVLVGIMIWGVFHEKIYATRWDPWRPGLELALHADALSVLFVTLSTILWFVTTLYAIGYLEHSPNRESLLRIFLAYAYRRLSDLHWLLTSSHS